MISTLKVKIRSGYAMAFFLLVLSYFLILGSTRRLHQQTSWVSSSQLALLNLERFYSSILSAEAGARGYLLTRNVIFLKPYRESLSKLPGLNRGLLDYFQTDSIQGGLMQDIQGMTTRRLDHLRQAILMYQRSGYKVTNELIAEKLESMLLMDSIHQTIEQLTTIEYAHMIDRRHRLSGYFSGTRTITLVSLIIAVIAILYSVITYNRENHAKSEADLKAHQYEAELKRNINELQEMNNELSELRSNEKFASTGRIARTIAHEVRNPLTNISLAAEQLQEDIGKSQESSLLLDMIVRNSERINQLVSDLLSATRFVQLNMQRKNVNELLDEALAMAGDRIDLRSIQVVKKYSPMACSVLVDADKIKLAFLNIIVNAIEAMEKNRGILRLKTEKADKRCIVEIADNGTGMDTDTLQKLFEPYFTVKPQGNGLGLTNSQNIILSHKGNIKVFSRLGEGSVFQIFLHLEEG
ncbi:MAG: CHASE3 domain-containing protein [Chitinophagaceae bacterium]|nr:CHASE3 domain-containing protein [Chitinophagaceae bacterium]